MGLKACSISIRRTRFVLWFAVLLIVTREQSLANELPKSEVAVQASDGGDNASPDGQTHDATQDFEEIRRARLRPPNDPQPTSYRHAFRGPLQVEQLPARVQAAEGQLTLFADYGDTWQGHVALYLVNRTDQEVKTPRESNDLYAKLEFQNESGEWQRAQTHRYSECGNSYDELRLPSGMFVQLWGWMPEKGEPASVRFKLYSRLQVVSNVSSGRIDRAIVEEARSDRMTLFEGSLERIEEILLGENAIPPNWKHDAIWRLSRFPPEQAVPLLERLIASHDTKRWAYSPAISVLARLAPERLLVYAENTLKSQDVSVRLDLLRHPFELDRCDDGRLRNLLLAESTAHDAPYLRVIMTFLGSTREMDAKQRLQAISEDSRFSSSLRMAAYYELEQWYGTPGIDVTVQSLSNAVQRDSLPVRVMLRNRTSRAITVRYDDPSDIVWLYATYETPAQIQAGASEFLPARASGPWARQVKPHAKHVVELALGAYHEMTMDLTQHYDLPADYHPKTSPLVVWPSCLIPGFHSTGSVSGGSGL